MVVVKLGDPVAELADVLSTLSNELIFGKSVDRAICFSRRKGILTGTTGVVEGRLRVGDDTET